MDSGSDISNDSDSVDDLLSESDLQTLQLTRSAAAAALACWSFAIVLFTGSESVAVRLLVIITIQSNVCWLKQTVDHALIVDANVLDGC